MSNVNINVVLFIFRLDGFKIALFACQNFRANASAVGAGYYFIGGMIFLEASHALHFGRYKTEVQLRVFRRRAFAEIVPMGLDGASVQFGYFAKSNLKHCGAF